MVLEGSEWCVAVVPLTPRRILCCVPSIEDGRVAVGCMFQKSLTHYILAHLDI